MVLSILLLAIWVASVWLDFGYMSKAGIGVGATEGQLKLVWFDGPSPTVIRGNGWLQEHPPTLRWWLQLWELPSLRIFFVPLWIPACASVAFTIFAWRRDATAHRRLLLNHCPTCGKDREGLLNPEALCPECGAAAPTAVSATERTARPTR